MRITKNLRDHFVTQKWVAADASDQAVAQAVGQKLSSGELSPAQFAELSREAVPTGVKSQLDQLTATVKAIADKVGLTAPVAPVAPAAPTFTLDEKGINALIERRLAALHGPRQEVPGGGMAGLLTRSASYLQMPTARVKEAVERYATVKSAAVHPARCGLMQDKGPNPFAGQRAVHSEDNIALETSSERDLAVSQAWWKFSIAKAHAQHEIPRHLVMTPHDHELLKWACENSKWSGFLLSAPDQDDPETSQQIKVKRRKLSDFEVKTLLDDSVSGGIEIAPIEFDDALVTIPVLHGELFPLVTVQNITRGRRVKGGAVANPTFTSGISEGTAIQPFNTASFITPFDTTIYVAVASMEIGLDFEEDSPTNIGATIIQKYGEKWLEWLDRVIAVGDGVTEPQGIFNASNTVNVQADFDTTGPATAGDYEGLMFGVNKAFRMAKGSRNVYMANETSYRRARGIAVGPGDERRLFGMSYGDYQLMGQPYKINIFIPNNQIAFANLGYWRGYRRLGLNTRIETQGQNLALKNTKLIVMRARMGGRLELGGAAATMFNAAN